MHLEAAEALEWSREIQVESKEECEHKAKHVLKKLKADMESGNEAINSGEPKKKRKGKLKKVND
ncbi:hypothetical protein EDC04DRAFT_2888947 [Pisolithus marmoratus]|nr:hypothetical protein EDC04DRAFT_2888947 [Pisolithus marmoratus]